MREKSEIDIRVLIKLLLDCKGVLPSRLHPTTTFPIVAQPTKATITKASKVSDEGYWRTLLRVIHIYVWQIGNSYTYNNKAFIRLRTGITQSVTPD